MNANSKGDGSTARVKVAVVSACAVVLAALITTVVPPLFRRPPTPPPEPIPVPEPVPDPGSEEVGSVPVKIECSGLIHDGEWLFIPDEEGHFSIEHEMILIPNGRPKQVTRSSEVVGGEVRLDMLLALKATEKGDVSASGSLELWEGPRWNCGGSVEIPETLIPATKPFTLFDGRVADKEGDWADVKLVVEAVP